MNLQVKSFGVGVIVAALFALLAVIGNHTEVDIIGGAVFTFFLAFIVAISFLAGRSTSRGD